MRGVAFDIHECVVWFLFFFYGGQYREQTAARAEISAETPRGINAARTRYHMLLQRSHEEDEEDERGVMISADKTHVKSSQMLREWHYGGFFNLSVYIFIGSNKKTQIFAMIEIRTAVRLWKTEWERKRKYVLTQRDVLFTSLCCCQSWCCQYVVQCEKLKRKKGKKRQHNIFRAIHLVFCC